MTCVITHTRTHTVVVATVAEEAPLVEGQLVEGFYQLTDIGVLSAGCAFMWQHCMDSVCARVHARVSVQLCRTCWFLYVEAQMYFVTDVREGTRARLYEVLRCCRPSNYNVHVHGNDGELSSDDDPPCAAGRKCMSNRHTQEAVHSPPYIFLMCCAQIHVDAAVLCSKEETWLRWRCLHVNSWL